MTPAELHEVGLDVRALVEPYPRRFEEPGPPPESAPAVSVIAVAFPLSEEPEERG